MKKIVEEFKIEHLQILSEDGTCDESDMPKLSVDQIKEIYEKMILVRTFDDKAFSMQRQGRIGSYLQVKGQEASQVGAVYALQDKDWLVPMYRNSGALLARKHPMHQLFMYWGGDERGMQSPVEVNNFPMAIPVGTQIAHAAGIGWAARLKGEKTVALTFFGDGATSKSEFHTGLNFAGVFKANTVFVCENNEYAISTPRCNQTNAQTIAQKAIAYGIKGIQVDGNDVFAVYKAVSEAVQDARDGKGPILIECLTYRIGDHSTSDDALRYRTKEEVEGWQKKDPIVRLEKYMKSKNILDEAYQKKVASQSKAMVEEAVVKFENYPPANKEDIFTYMFAEMPEQLKHQYDEYRGELE
ncbi:MAG: pyruvate dehydrogenase (acetyl-transferring) E1 component subunit alpha [archaeon]